ncbi:TIGR02281 family clan AA aspartic protease [Rhizobium sp. MC63]|uniref:TIGR02281 family clan AA aspartic protease n=1 Tax=Rhizobium mulingense TaxID=3031128 RepID=A0ACC6N1V0_9HYPH|nr:MULTISPECIES: TIGR02281 family clan AA aspartic protease [unclassified Rhizobium]MDF0695750.1 TIGR02281 family clan AA aspartic protease [Rhizobium sp. MC63]MEA3519368.1 TIGR02281 family clan AA aspartic protease [Rhizobium sp. MJ31]
MKRGLYRKDFCFMLVRTIIFASIAAVLATQVPSFFAGTGEQPAETPSANYISTESGTPAAPISGSNAIRLQADAQGHYTGSFKINGKPVQGLIDTGATYVALNETLARRLGFTANQLDFRYGVNTANGQTKAAHVTLDRIEIGGIRVRDVEAFVLKDEALTTTLVGMSFLQKLASYSVADGSLSLKQ